MESDRARRARARMADLESSLTENKEFQQLLREVEECKGRIPIEKFRSHFVNAGGNAEFDRKVRNVHSCKEIAEQLWTFFTVSERKLILTEVRKRCSETPVENNPPCDYKPFCEYSQDPTVEVGKNIQPDFTYSLMQDSSHSLLVKSVQPVQETQGPDKDVADLRDHSQELLQCGDIETHPGPGFEAKFVHPLLKRHECPICLYAMRNPVQTECGHLFCKECLDPVLKKRRPICPLDKEEITQDGIFPDNACRREILNLEEYCNYVAGGCQWVGHLKDLESHLESCEHREIQCIQCGQYIQAVSLKAHQEVECPMRPEKCAYCHQEVPSQQMEDHIKKVCPDVLHKCPNGCNSKLEFKLPELHQHSAREISMSPTERVISQVLDALKEDDGAKVLAVIKSRGGFDVNTFIKGDKTPLMLAAILDSKQVAKVLLDNNASVNVKDEDGATPLFLAVTNGNYEIMKLLVQAGSNVNHKAKDIPMLLEPSAKGFSMIVQYLLENGARPNITNKDGQSPLMAAAGNGQKDVVMVLLTHGADVTLVNKKTSSNALQEAIEGGHIDVVVLLMKATTEARKKSDRLFTCKTSEEVRQLIKDGGKVDQRRGDDATPLMVQARAGNLEVVQELIRSGANVDLQDDLGQTALMKASEGGHFGVVQTLVTSRAILDLKTKQGETALMLTTRRKNVHIVKELLLAGADPSARDKVGQSVYDIAKGQGSDDIIEALKKHSTVSNKSSPLVQVLSSYFQEKESATPKTTPLKSRRPGSAKSGSTLIKKSSGGLKPLVARGVAKEDRDESVMKSELDKAWRRVADLETRVHELTLKTTMELSADQEDLSYLERGRLEEEYRKLKELKKKSETYSIEAKQTAQRLGAENFKLKEQLSQEKHLSDITQHNLKREIDNMKLEVKRGASSSDLAAIKAEVFEEEVTSRAYQLLRKMPKPTWAMAQSTNASFDLRPEAVCDIILHHSVRACLVQLVIGGLPYSGKSTLLQNMLPQEAAKREEVPGLKIYEAVMMNDMVDDQALGNWVPFVKDGAELLSLAAALAQVCAKQTALPSDLIGQSSTSVLEQVVERMFPTSSINEHFYKSYTCLKDLLVKMEKKGDLYKLLYTTLTFVNIWDIGLNKAVYEILVLMANKCDNLLLVNVLDLKRDGQNLDKPLDLKDTEVYNGRYSNRKDEERVLRRHSAGNYFTRFVTACNPSNNTTLLVGTHEDSFQEDELEDAVFEVEQSVLDRARGMGVADCVHDKMLAVDATNPEGGKTVCGAVESMIKHERRFLIDIPVAWIFFRCVLQATGKFFMGRNDMLTVAMECGLKNEAEFEKWLTTFQKCSSIFYSPDKNLVSLHDNVILRPIEFVRCLDRLYYAEFDEELAQKTSLMEDLKLLQNGLLTETLARELWQDEVCDRNTERSSQHQRCELLLKVLQDLEASICIPATMCSELTGIKSQCFFLPSLRQEVCVTPPTDHTHSFVRVTPPTDHTHSFVRVTPPTDHTHSFVEATGVCTIQHQLQNQFISRFQTSEIDETSKSSGETGLTSKTGKESAITEDGGEPHSEPSSDDLPVHLSVPLDNFRHHQTVALRVHELEGKVVAMAADVNQRTQDISEGHVLIQNLQGEIAALKEAHDKQQSYIASLETELKQIKEEVQVIARKPTVDKNQLSKVSELEKLVSERDQYITRQKRDLDEVKKQLSSLKTKSDSNAALLQELQLKSRVTPPTRRPTTAAADVQYSNVISETRFIQLEHRVEDLARETSTTRAHLQELEIQLQAQVAATYNGSCLWRIPDVAKRRRDALEDRILSSYSPAFYTGRHGFPLNAVMRGDYDALSIYRPIERHKIHTALDDDHYKCLDWCTCCSAHPVATECLNLFTQPVSNMDVLASSHFG